MALSKNQCEAACLYWAQFITGEISNHAFQSKVVPFMASIEIYNRQRYLQELAQNNPAWIQQFMINLFNLLNGLGVSTKLSLDIYPQGLLKQALDMTGISHCVFPMGKLEMSFDTQEHLIIGQEIISADEYLMQSMMKSMGI